MGANKLEPKGLEGRHAGWLRLRGAIRAFRARSCGGHPRSSGGRSLGMDRSSRLSTHSTPRAAALRYGCAAATNSSAANELMGILQRAPLDGLASGPALALQAQSLAARASTGDAAALGQADRLLSTAWVMYVQALQTPPAGMTYAEFVGSAAAFHAASDPSASGRRKVPPFLSA